MVLSPHAVLFSDAQEGKTEPRAAFQIFIEKQAQGPWSHQDGPLGH